MNAQEKLAEWARSIEDTVPLKCPSCDKDLSQVRYVTDCTRTTIHLTGASNDAVIHKALCPHCAHVLASGSAGGGHWR